TSSLQPNEILREIRIATPPTGSTGTYLKFSRRSQDWAIVAVAAQVTVSGHNVANVAIGLTGMGSRPLRASGVEQALRGKGAHDEDIRAAAERAADEHRYVADRSLATTIFLALTLDKPLLLEGEAGVGKTEVGKVLAEILDSRLIRLQCYEGIDVNNAVYEWAYAKQMLHIRLLESAGAQRDETEREIYSHQFLVKRPLLQAIESEGARPPVLLIDEIDRADDEFEAFLLELLSDFQISIPEIGT